MPAARRFPPPWTAEETEACSSSATRTGRRYVYFEDEPGHHARPSWSRRIAASIAKLPELPRAPRP
jgi:hypothetical protein